MAAKSVLFRFGSDVSGLVSGLAQGKGGLRDLDKAADGVTGTLTKFAGLLGAGLGIAKLTADALAFADSMVRIHDQTDLSFESIQRFSFIAGQTGGNVEQMAGAVSKMQRTLSDAGDDGEKARKAIAGLGLDVTALMAMQPDQQFQAIANAISEIPNPADQAAAAVDVFGKAGAEMLPQLKAMAESGTELAVQFDALGGPVSENAIKAVDALGDAGAATGLAVKNLATELLAVASPAIITGLQTIQEILGGIRVLTGHGADAIVNMTMQIDGLEASLAALKANNPFPDVFAQQQMDDYVTRIAKLKQAQQDMLGVGAQSVRTIIPTYQEWGAVILARPILTAQALEHERELETNRTLAQQADLQMQQDQVRLYWENVKAITEQRTGEQVDVEMAGMSALEEFHNSTWQNQVLTVAKGLQQMTAGLAQHSRIAFEINKGAAEAIAVVNVIQAVGKALDEYPWPYNAVVAAAIAAAGAVQIAAINSTSFNGGGRGLSPSSATMPAQNVGQGNGSARGTLRVQGLHGDGVYSGKSARAAVEHILEWERGGGQVVYQ